MASGLQIFISLTLLFLIIFVAGWGAHSFYITEVVKLKKKSFKQDFKAILRLASEIAIKHSIAFSVVMDAQGKGYGMSENTVYSLGYLEPLDQVIEKKARGEEIE